VVFQLVAGDVALGSHVAQLSDEIRLHVCRDVAQSSQIAQKLVPSPGLKATSDRQDQGTSERTSAVSQPTAEQTTFVTEA